MSYLNPYQLGLGDGSVLEWATAGPRGGTIDVVPPPDWTVRAEPTGSANMTSAQLFAAAAQLRQGGATADAAMFEQRANAKLAEENRARAARAEIEQVKAAQARAAEVARNNAAARAAAAPLLARAKPDQKGWEWLATNEAAQRDRALAQQRAAKQAASTRSPAGPDQVADRIVVVSPPAYSGPVYTPGRISATLAAATASANARPSALAPLAPLSLQSPQVAVQTPSTISRVLPWLVVGVVGLMVVAGTVSYFRKD